MNRRFEVRIDIPNSCELIGCRSDGNMAIIVFEDCSGPEIRPIGFVGNIPEKYRTPSKMNKKEAIPKNHPSHRYKYNDLFGICKWDDIGKTNAEAGHVTIPKYTSVIHGIDCSK